MTWACAMRRPVQAFGIVPAAASWLVRMPRLPASASCTSTLLALCIATNVWAAPPNKAPTVAITAPTNGATFTAPAAIAINANAADSDGTVARVEFYQGTTLLGTSTSAPYKWTWTAVPGGTYSLTAKAIDNLGASKTSSGVSITVSGPKLLITTPTTGSVVYASSVTVNGSFVGDANATVLIDNGSTSRVATLNGSSFSATLPIHIGPNTLRVTVTRRDRSFDHAAVTVVGNAPPLLVFTSPPTTVFDTPANVQFDVDAASPSGTIVKVDFLRGSTLLGTATAPPFRYTWSNIAAGNYTITARATDNNAVASAASLSILVRGPNAPPVVGLTAPTNGAAFAAPANIALAAAASDSDGSISLVEFLQNGNVIGTTNASPYSMTWSNVAAGAYTLVARATDNRSAVSTSSPINIMVTPPNVPPVVALVAPSTGSAFAAPATISLAATATDSDGTVAKVDFFEGATLIGTDSTAPYTLNWSNVAAGTYSLSARATDSSGAVASSAAVAVIVNQNSAPTVTLTSPGAPATYYAPATVVLTASASDNDGTVARVEFYQGSVLIGTATSHPYSVSWSSVPAGTYTLTAKAFDDLGASASSNSIQVTVNPLSVAISVPLDGASVAGDSITVSGTVEAPVNSGLTVNGVLAAIEPGGRFHATGVPLALGANDIVATLSTPDGQSRVRSITVSSSGSAPVRIDVAPTQGLAPLPVTFEVFPAEGVTIQRVEIDGDTDGRVDYTIDTAPWSTTLTYGGTGTTTATVRVTDTEGNVYASTTPIVMHSETALDQTIRAVWNGFTNALAAADKSLAMQFMGGPLQQRYSAPLDTLSSRLPQIAASFSPLQLVSLSMELGEYAVNRLINGENRLFLIYFGQDGDGVWRLQSM